MEHWNNTLGKDWHCFQHTFHPCQKSHYNTTKGYMISKLTLTSKFNQFNLEYKCRFVADLTNFHHCILELMCPQFFQGIVTFDLQRSRSSAVLACTIVAKIGVLFILLFCCLVKPTSQMCISNILNATSFVVFWPHTHNWEVEIRK